MLWCGRGRLIASTCASLCAIPSRFIRVHMNKCHNQQTFSQNQNVHIFHNAAAISKYMKLELFFSPIFVLSPNIHHAYLLSRPHTKSKQSTFIHYTFIVYCSHCVYVIVDAATVVVTLVNLFLVCIPKSLCRRICVRLILLLNLLTTKT